MHLLSAFHTATSIDYSRTDVSVPAANPLDDSDSRVIPAFHDKHDFEVRVILRQQRVQVLLGIEILSAPESIGS